MSELVLLDNAGERRGEHDHRQADHADFSPGKGEGHHQEHGHQGLDNQVCRFFGCPAGVLPAVVFLENISGRNGHRGAVTQNFEFFDCQAG